MIDLYTWSTPNGRRAPIMLEECGLAYAPHYLELAKHEHKTEEMKKINWDQRIPVIVDPEGPDGKPIAVSESCAILLYLAEKTGKLLPKSGAARVEAQKWLFFAATNVGPAATQHFWLPTKSKLKGGLPPVEPFVDLFNDELKRLYGAMDGRLGEAEYLAGDYSIADIAAYVWVWRRYQQKIDLAAYPNLNRWFMAVNARPAVQKGEQIPPRSDGL